MSEFDNIKKDILESAKKMGQSRTSGYDTTATVTRVEGSTAWVHIPGGVIETPAQLTISAKAGDAVQVRVADGSAWITGNATAPPTDDAKAIAATTIATGAQRSAEIANAAAESAQESAAIAAEAATEAMASATTANTAANGALTQLSVVEDVVGVLTWISNHGVYTASTDTEVMPGKFYFTRSGSAGSYTYTVVTNPTGNPSTQGYYELSSVDEAVSNYVASHLALTNAGLWVIKDNQGYKSLMANDGMKIYDATGNLVATFGESITFSSSRPQYIGNSTAYLSFTPNSNTMELHGKVYADGGQIGGWYIDDYLWYQREESGVIDTTWLDGDRIYGKRQTSGIAASVGYELNTKGELELYGRDAGSPSLTITKTMGNIRKYGILYENSILFQQNNPSYNISLDAGTDGTNGTLTLGGTPGNVYFIAPNIKATGAFYGSLTGHASLDLPLTGGTLTGNITIGQTTDTAVRTVAVLNSLSNVALAVGGDGKHGIFSNTKGNWLLYATKDANSTNSTLYVPRPLTVSGLVSVGNNVIATASDTSERYFRAVNSNGSIELNASAGNKGIYDRSGSRWIMYLDTNSTGDTPVRIPRALHIGTADLNGYIELYHATPYIDFHFGRSTEDYTYRIMETSSGTLWFSGSQSVAGNITISTTSTSVERAVTVSTGNVSGAVRANNGGSGGAFGLYVTKTGGTARTGTWLSAMDSGGTYHANWTSDRREKNLIGLMSDQEAETLLRNIDIINFSYKSDQNQIVQNGMIAQQMRDVLKENGIGYRSYLNITATHDDDFIYDLNAPEADVRYGIDYARLTPILWKGWQLHDERIAALEAEIKALKGVA